MLVWCVWDSILTRKSVFRFSAIKMDQNVIPPCCYWLLEEKPLHHYENCKPPLASHPPLHLPLAHIRHLSHPRFHFGSPLPAVWAASAPLPHPCCFLSHSTTPTLKLHPSPLSFWPLPSSFPPFLLHASWIIHMCISPGNFSVFCLFARGERNLYAGITDDPCKYKKDTKSWVIFFVYYAFI